MTAAIHFTDGVPVRLEEWRLTWTALAGDEQRTFTIVIPATSDDAAMEAMHNIAMAVEEASSGVYGPLMEGLVERAGDPS